MSGMSHVSEERNFIGEESVVFKLERGSGDVQEQKDFTNVFDMLFRCVAEDHNVSQENKREWSYDA